MKKRTQLIYAVLLLLGIAILFASMYLRNLGYPKPVAGFCIGLGGWAVTVGITRLFTLHTAAADPEYSRRKRIEDNDERNLAVQNRAKAKGFDAMGIIFGVIMMIYVLINPDLIVILLLAAGYVAVYAVQMYYLSKYSKEM